MTTTQSHQIKDEGGCCQQNFCSAAADRLHLSLFCFTNWQLLEGIAVTEHIINLSHDPPSPLYRNGARVQSPLASHHSPAIAGVSPAGGSVAEKSSMDILGSL